MGVSALEHGLLAALSDEVRLFCGCLVTRSAALGIMNTCPLCGAQRELLVKRPTRREGDLGGWAWVYWLFGVAGMLYSAHLWLDGR